MIRETSRSSGVTCAGLDIIRASEGYMNNMRCLVGLALVLCVTYSFSQSARVPAVPLITHDPYFSIWSMNDKLTDGPTRHGTGAAQPLAGLVRIDGRVFRWMGSTPQAVPALRQTALEITATRTTYHFEERGLKLEVSFLSPLLPNPSSPFFLQFNPELPKAQLRPLME